MGRSARLEVREVAHVLPRLPDIPVAAMADVGAAGLSRFRGVWTPHAVVEWGGGIDADCAALGSAMPALMADVRVLLGAMRGLDAGGSRTLQPLGASPWPPVVVPVDAVAPDDPELAARVVGPHWVRQKCVTLAAVAAVAVTTGQGIPVAATALRRALKRWRALADFLACMTMPEGVVGDALWTLAPLAVADDPAAAARLFLVSELDEPAGRPGHG